MILSSPFVIIGPGHLSYAGDGTLEKVAARRLTNHWGLTQDWRGYAVLIAPADCALMGRAGWLVAGGKVSSALVVDCEQQAHKGQLKARGLLADVNIETLTHQKAWLVLK